MSTVFGALVVAGCLGIAVSGFSVGMAMIGKEEPNLGAFRVGSPRGEVQLQLGSPISSVTNPDGGRTDIYEYEIGNKPSAGRAAGHAVMDVLTLGLWEIVGTPIEAFQGETRRLAITYDAQDRVQAINQASVPTSPSAETGGASQVATPPQATPAVAAKDPLQTTIEHNNRNLLRLRIGMSRDQVHEVMGDPERSEGYTRGTVWYYRTARTGEAQQGSPEADFTPIVLSEQGTLVGWGGSGLANYRR